MEIKKNKFNLKILLYTLIVLNILNLIDVIITQIGVGYRGFIEQNNFLVYSFDKIGMINTHILKIIIGIIFAILIYKLVKYFCEDSLERFNASKKIGWIYTFPIMLMVIIFSKDVLNNLILLGG